MKPTTKEAKRIQERYRQQIDLSPLETEVETVAGADISYNWGSNILYAGIVTLSLPDLEEVSRSLVVYETDFPYVPGLLAFRELPPLLACWEQIPYKPDVVALDGQGIAHPRRMGIATHFGIEVDHPTFGCAKNVLTGDFEEPGTQKGDFSWMWDDGEKVGVALRSRTGVKPIFISPGHRLSFEDSRRIAMRCLDRFKLPETTRSAHKLVNQLRKGEIRAGYFER